MYCQKCNANLPDGSKFCVNCGYKFEDNKLDKYCFKCGEKIKSIDIFCPFCGIRQNSGYSQQENSNINKPDYTDDKPINSNNKIINDNEKNALSGSIKRLVTLVTILIIALVILLPFHYVIGYDSGLKIFAKQNLSFSYTFITKKTVDEIIERYNKANLWEKISIREEYIVKKLMAEGILIEKKD